LYLPHRIVGAVLCIIATEAYRSVVPSEESLRLDSLEETLEPFVEVARNRFPQLETRVALERLQEELAEVRQLAEPPEMVFESHQLQRSGEGRFLLIKFGRSKDVPLGSLQFTAALLSDSKVRILEFEPAQSSMNTQSQISEDGTSARLGFALPGSEDPVIKLLLSGAAQVKIEGNHDLKPVLVDVK